MPGQHNQKIWTGTEVARLRQYVNQGLTNRAIAEQLGRTVSSVSRKLTDCKIRRFVNEDAVDFTIRIPKELYDKFSDEAKRRGMSKSHLYRTAIEAELKRNTK